MILRALMPGLTRTHASMLASTRPDPARSSSSFGRLDGMSSRGAWAIVLLVGLAGCVATVGDLSTDCLEQRPGDIRCCLGDGHIDQGICCPAGMHAVPDVEHPDWRACVWDEVD